MSLNLTYDLGIQTWHRIVRWPTAIPKVRLIGLKGISQKESAFEVFSCHDLDLDPMTMVDLLKLDLDTVVTY